MTTLFNYDPYFDDFDEDKNFMRVLFRPGYAVQARELTQLQTILSNQIEKFGNHIFKSGSPIIGGKISLDYTTRYLILQPQYENNDIILEDFLNKTVISYNSSKSVRAKVVAIDNTNASAPTLVLKYLSGDFFSEDDELKIFGQNIFAKAASTNAKGFSFVASIQEGVYYFKGQFIKVVPQFLVLNLFYKIGYNTSKINSSPSWKIGIQFDETIVDDIDDTSLLDPAQGSFNYQAPGAHRFQINTTLSKRTLDSADQSSFFEVIRIVNGTKTKEIDYPVYGEIEKTLARRTFDESGNYTVDPFVISLEEGRKELGKFDVVLDPGKAYVGGYEFQTIAPTKIELNRARTTRFVDEYDIPTNYTSYVVLNTVSGTLDISSFPQLDVHCVVQSAINTSTTATYNSTKIGTLNANMIKYVGSTDPNLGTTHKFAVNVFNVNGSPITGNVRTGSTSTVINLPTTFSTTATANAYADMFFKITNGLGTSVSAIRIASSNSVARTVTLSSPLPFTPTSTNTFSIESDFKVSESIVSGSSLTFAGDVDGLSKTSAGFSYINEPNRTSLIFDVPFESIKAATIENFDFFAKKVYSNKISGGDGIINISTEGTDTFAFAGTPGTLSDSVILDNIICFVRTDSVSNTTSGITPGKVLSLANNNFSVTAVSSTSLNINLNTVGVRADFIVTSRVNNAENGTTGAIRGKQLLPLTTGANLHAKVPFELGGANTLEAANSANKTIVSGVGTVYNDIGATYFDNTTSMANLRTPGVAVSLQVPDVYQIVRITDSLSRTGNVTTAMLTNSAYDVTNNFEFDNGQRKTHYDHATIKLKRGYPSPKGKIYVQYKYLNHQSAPSPQNDGLFTVDSYLKDGSNFTYDEISVFDNREDGKLMSLRSSFDFRPTRQIGGTALSGAINPDPDLTGSASFEHYLSRIDRIVVQPSKRFHVISGTSAVNPVPPAVSAEDMLIYTLKIPAYTETAREVQAEFENNRRFTMRDIGNFDRRIKSLEYYVSLNALEKDTTALKVLDSNGLERSKYGILVDNFSTTSTQATYSEVGFDNRCLVENNELKPASLMRTFKLELNESLSTGNFKVVGNPGKQALMLNYSTKVLANQPLATKSAVVAGALFANFKGVTQLYPEYSAEVDQSTTAKVTLNSFTGLENFLTFFNTSNKALADASGAWSTDRDNPYAKIPTSSYYTETKSTTSETALLGESGFIQTFGNIQTTTTNSFQTTNFNLTQQQAGVSTSKVDAGSYVTDISIQPYIKPSEIVFASEGLRPNTSYYAFFDEIPVSLGALRADYFGTVYPTIANPNKITLTASSGTFRSIEKALIANNTSELNTAISNFESGTPGFSMVSIVDREEGTTTYSVINYSALDTLAGKVVYGISSKARGTINLVQDHKSGLVRDTTSTTITLSPDAPSVNIAGNTIVFVTDTAKLSGEGHTFVVTAYNTSTKVATVTGTAPNSLVASGRWLYSIGTPRSNRFGQLAGAFFPRASTFRNGERVFRVTESFNDSYDADSISFSEATYLSSGLKLSKTDLVNTVYNVKVDSKIVGSTSSTEKAGTTVSKSITSTWSVDNTPPPPPPPPIPTLPVNPATPEIPAVEVELEVLPDWGSGGGNGGGDPLAQTFYVDGAVYPYGVFVDSVDLYFRAKDDENIPVVVQIRPTVNGAPHYNYWYPESVVVKYPSQINVSENPSVTRSETKTNFQFYSPVFLAPGLHALVIKTDSPDYTIWVAEKGALTLNKEIVSVNPYIGTLYKSQNAMEYVPLINEDLMFTMNRCLFSGIRATYYLQTPSLPETTYFDKFRVLETKLKSISDDVLRLNYSFVSTPIGASKETNYRGLSPMVTYSMGDDDLYTLGNRRKQLRNKGDFTLKIEMATVNDAVCPLISVESLNLNAWENFIDNATISADDFNIVDDGAGYSNSNTIIITSSTGLGATARVIVDGQYGNVVGINVLTGGSGYMDDYTISLPNTSDPSGNITANAVIVLNSEFDESGGPCEARYITKAVTLADGFDAGDLRVLLNGNIPPGTDIHVFYKILSGSDATPFKQRKYQKMERFNTTVVASKTSNDFTEFEYRPSLIENSVSYVSDDGVTYDSFKTFSIKIVLTSVDPAVIPKVRDLRVIALPAE